MREHHQKWLKLARLVAANSHCRSRQVGAVIVDKHGGCVAKGTNTSPIGSCIARNECYENLSECKGSNLPSIAIHAETNAIINALQSGFDIEGATVYSTVEPCISCLKLIICCGIKKVYFEIPSDKPDIARDLLVNKKVVSLKRVEIYG